MKKKTIKTLIALSVMLLITAIGISLVFAAVYENTDTVIIDGKKVEIATLLNDQYKKTAVLDGNYRLKYKP